MHQKKVMLLILLLIPVISAQLVSSQQQPTYIISNSEDWRDVYSVMIYSSLTGITSDFLVSERHGLIILNAIDKANRLEVISSRTKPFILGYQSMIENQGFASAQELVYTNVNLELGRRTNTKNFIVVGDSYGYNAIALAPYATLKKSWVLFANRRNIAEIENFLNTRQRDELLVYGYVDREVKNALAQFNPTTINKGDRFSDNIEITKRYLAIKNTKQVILTNGEFIEKEIMIGASPVLFTGGENVPDQIREYIQSSDIEIGVLIGNDLVGAATNIRRTAGISVMVKFARSARNPAGTISPVEGLDLFPVPTPLIILKLSSVKYNRATGRLEVTYKSESNIPIYIKGTINLISGTASMRVGDIDSIFLAPNDFKTIIYSGINISIEDLRARIFTIFGESKRSLEKVLEQEVNVSIVDVIDKCEIQVNAISYKTFKKAFYVDIENIGDTDCFVDIELPEIIIDGEVGIVGTSGSIEIKAKSKKKIEVLADLTDEDLRANKFVTVLAYYGEKADSLTKVFKGKFELKIIRINSIYIIIAIIIIILLILFFILFWRRRKKEEDEDDF